MSLLGSSSDLEVQRLLDMFPLTALRSHWPDIKTRTKEDLCEQIAGQRGVSTITEFLTSHVSCCKQHVYVFSHQIPLKSVPTINFGPGTKIWEHEKRTETLVLLRVVYHVSLANPPSDTTLTFLWPVTLTWQPGHLIVRFVTLEKSIKAYFEAKRAPMLRGRDVDEEPTIAMIIKQAGGSLETTDLHKGIKKLWADGFVDGLKVQYKRSSSTASESMDPDKGIKQCYPELYKTLLKESWNYVLFCVMPAEKELSVSNFTVYPTEGRLGFSRFSATPGDTDYVVGEILRHN